MALLGVIGIFALKKAVEILFDEGRKILVKRITSEKPQSGLAPGDEIEPNATEVKTQAPDTAALPDRIDTKEKALGQPIEESLWNRERGDVEHLVKLLEIHIRNHHLAEEQLARFGGVAFAPPIVINNLREEEKEIVSNMNRLQKILTRVYGREVSIPEIGEILNTP